MAFSPTVSKTKADFHAAVSKYHQTGQFSDFTIVCSGKEYHVHRCFIVHQSRYFERACIGMFKEGVECKIELREDSSGIVDHMISYFYNFDYHGNFSYDQKTSSHDLWQSPH